MFDKLWGECHLFLLPGILGTSSSFYLSKLINDTQIDREREGKGTKRRERKGRQKEKKGFQDATTRR